MQATFLATSATSGSGMSQETMLFRRLINTVHHQTEYIKTVQYISVYLALRPSGFSGTVWMLDEAARCAITF